MTDFVHLHVHSDYSLLDGLSQIKPLVKAAKAKGSKALALTDYGSMYGAIEFYQACKSNGIKPIIGFEAYIAPKSRFSTDSERDKDPYHLVLLAKNYNGYRNLMKLSSYGHLEGFYNGKPRIDKELLKEYGQDIIALSGCIKGEVPSLLKEGKLEDAKRVALEYNTIFGQGNFYLELQDHPAISGQIDVNTKCIQLSKDTGTPLVVTRDIHYMEPDEAEAADILTCIREGWKVGYTDREDFRQVDRSYNSADDIASRFRHVPEAVENTIKIAEQVNIEIELDKWHFAPVELPPGKTADDVLHDEAYKYVGNYYDSITPEIKERLDYELGIIKEKGYSPYFICVADYVRYAKEHGIVESTRGSAAGSLVSYALGITTVDPLRFKLPFERFLNPYRPSPPDIDTDFADDRREDMIEYVTAKYGADRVAQIITFGTMAARASVRDVGRALGLSYSFCDQVAKLIPPGAQGFPMTIERALKEEPDLKKLYENNPDVKRLISLAKQVEGCARHTSIHAAGVVISPTPLTDFTPVQREVGGEKITTQYEMKSVEAAGVLKNDFLGIRNLAILGNAVDIVEKTTGERVDIYNLPLDDTKTFDMLARGETMGVFQLGGSGMTRWLKELKPNRIDDIMAMVALYRPGPMESIPQYIERKHHPEKIVYLDKRLQKILDASYGLLVYQEDVMLTAIALAGYDWLDADKFRKAMGKKIPEEMAKQKEKFYKGCLEIGKVKKDIIDELWRAIEPFAAYGFGKAHAASYGIVAYQTAYMKANYPVQYMTAVLQAEATDTEKVAVIVSECDRMGIQVLPPDVNESFKNFAMVSKPGEPGRIRFGLTTIKGLGDHISDVVYRERKEHDTYKNLEDFLERIHDKDLNKKSLESLIKVGALDAFGYDRGILVANIESILFFARQHREKAISNQNSLFAGTSITLDSKVSLREAPIATMDEKLVWEKSLLGLYVSSHPFAPFVSYFKDKLIKLNEIENTPRDTWVTIGGVVDSVERKITKKGSVMLFVRMQDQSGSMELLVFPKKVEETKDAWKEGAVVCVVGKTPREEGENKIFVENVYVLNEQNAAQISRQVGLGNSLSHSETKSEKLVEISLSKDEIKEYENELKQLFTQFAGEYRVYFNIGGKKMRTHTKVDAGGEFREKLSAIVGDTFSVFE